MKLKGGMIKSLGKDGSVVVQEDCGDILSEDLIWCYNPAQHAVELLLHKLFTQGNREHEGERERESGLCTALSLSHDFVCYEVQYSMHRLFQIYIKNDFHHAHYNISA